MTRIAGWMVVGLLWSGTGAAGDGAPAPRLPLPVEARGGATVLASLRQAMKVERTTPAPEPPPIVDSNVVPAADHSPAGSVIPGSPLKKWLCFRPTTAHALPWLKPQEYVGPITGQFPCTSAAGCAPSADKPACELGGGAGKGMHGILNRGCRNGDGTCIPPPDDVFSGYRFAAPESPSIGGKGTPPAGPYSTGYRGANKTPTVVDALKRTFARP